MENTPYIDKIIDVIAFLLHEAPKPLTQYHIVKAIFLADRDHLNRYGRPITYDNYVAMKHGPVPSFAYDCLKNNSAILIELGRDSFPWKEVETDQIEQTSQNTKFFEACGEPQVSDLMSESDEIALKAALNKVLARNFNNLRKLRHKDPAWQEAWSNRGVQGSNKMNYALLFDKPDQDQADFIAESSKYLECAN